MTLGVSAGVRDLAAVAHEEHEQPPRGRAGKGEGDAAAVAPLNERAAVPPLVLWLVHVAEDEAAAVARAAVGRVCADRRRDARAAPVGADDERCRDLAHDSVGVAVADAGDATGAPVQRLEAAALADLGPLLARCLDEADVLEVARHADAEVVAGGGRPHALGHDRPLGANAELAHDRRVEGEDARQRAHAGELLDAGWEQHVGGELIGGERHPVEDDHPPARTGQRRRNGASGEAAADDDDVSLLGSSQTSHSFRSAQLTAGCPSPASTSTALGSRSRELSTRMGAPGSAAIAPGSTPSSAASA